MMGIKTLKMFIEVCFVPNTDIIFNLQVDHIMLNHIMPSVLNPSLTD